MHDPREPHLTRAYYIRSPWAACVRQVGPLCGEAQSLAYKYVHLFLDLIEQPLSPSNNYVVLLKLFLSPGFTKVSDAF
jgi:hypothetical protein